MKLYYKKNRLKMFWYVGKFVFEKHNSFSITYEKLSCFLQYYFGMSEDFSISNLILMEKFYYFFPMYTKGLSKLSWKIILKIIDMDNDYDRRLYFKIAIFCNCNYHEFEKLLQKKITF